MTYEQPTNRLPVGPALLMLMIRGVLLWLVVPATAFCWLLAWPVWRLKRIRLAQLLGWVDLNLVAAIERSVLRPLVSTPLPWTPAAELRNVKHRISAVDPV